MTHHDVFVSYRRDGGSHFATAVRSELERAGLDVALDVDILKGGRDWRPALVDSIAHSRHFVLLLTRGSFERMNDPDDVVAHEVATAYASGCHVVVLCDDRAGFPTRDTILPEALAPLKDAHILLYEHLMAKESIRKLFEALEADSRSRQREAVTDFARLDAEVGDPAFQAWQTQVVYEAYAEDAAQRGWTAAGLFFPMVRGRRFPVMCFESAIDTGAFEHRQLAPGLLRRPVRELPKLVVDPEAPIPAWVAMRPNARRYFELLSYAQRVRRWNMRGFALAALRLDEHHRVTSFDARICTYGENCLTSHVLGFDLLEAWRRDRNPRMIERPPLDAVVRIDGDDFLPLISVQAIVAFRGDDGDWQVVTMERAGDLAAAAGFSQFPPAGGFEIFGSEAENDRYVRQQFDIRLALMREFLEEIFGDVEMACELPADSGKGHDSAPGYRMLFEALRTGKAAIHFLGVVTELVSLRPEFSFLIVIDDLDHFRAAGYTHVLPGGEVAEARWLTSRSETKRLEKESLGDLDDLLNDRKWHSSSMGMLVLLARASRVADGWLRTRYPDFPELVLD